MEVLDPEKSTMMRLLEVVPNVNGSIIAISLSIDSLLTINFFKQRSEGVARKYEDVIMVGLVTAVTVSYL